MPDEPEVDDRTFGRLLQWMRRNLRHDLSLTTVARHAAVSTRTLSRRFRERVGTSPGEWVARVRVREAQRLLETTSLSVEDVADATGFGAATILRERFKSVVGTSPLQYRQTFRARRVR